MTTEYIRLSVCVDPLWREGPRSGLTIQLAPYLSYRLPAGLHQESNPPMKRYRLKER